MQRICIYQLNGSDRIFISGSECEQCYTTEKEEYNGTVDRENKASFLNEDCESNVSDFGDTDVFDWNVGLKDFLMNACPNNDKNDYTDDKNNYPGD